MGRLREFPPITAEEAYAALRWFVAKGTIRSAQITAALRDRDELVSEIRNRLAAMDGEGIARLSARIQPHGRRTRRRVSKAQRDVWKLTGAYMGTVKGLSKSDRAKVQAIREKSGIRAAIAAAKRMSGYRTRG